MEIPKTLTVPIPSESRHLANLMNPSDCPVARATRKFLPEGEISVGGSDVWLTYEGTKYIYNVPGMPDWLHNACASEDSTPEANFTLNLVETINLRQEN